ncbi:5-methylthioadenosine/S-adenosylhomocysteine deaminase [Virgibacillus halotolerans]|uniref:amidohydrolase family protein n=1 Tax=Virgibacillus halotolerans TaxID=1071053 RepID=UPI00195FB7FD|nr:amidohydrolase family protein [Virgibacillus halotolerans]MBM7601054.1 5-methylthioadenosine/S-adenosylhomocysteine deaminase [Virgibacillus halotolerans]
MRLKNATFLNGDIEFETRDFSIEAGKIRFNVNDSDKESSMDCENYFVIPGLINAHFHSYSPLTKGLMKEMALQDWCNDSEQGKIQQLFFDYVDNEISERDFAYVAQKSYVDMVKHGVTFVSDSDPKSPALLSDAMNEIGIRGIIDTYEEIGDYYNKRKDNVLFGSHLLEEEDFTNEELLRVKSMKDKYNPIMMTHCLENEWRFDIVKSKFGKSSIELYNEMDLLDNQTVLFHGVFMSKKDIALIAKQKSSIVHCPLSNLDTGAGVADVSYMLEKGVNVCLGTDYAHTNMWELMRLTYYLLKINNSVNKFAAEDIFKMATVNGAKAYKLEEEIGQIKDGYKADLVFIKKHSDLGPLLNKATFSSYLYNLLFYSKGDAVQHVMVDGKWIMKDRKLTTVDEQKVENRYIQIAAGFLTYLKEQGY